MQRGREHDAAIRAYVKAEGLTMPEKVGERFGYDVLVRFEAAPEYDQPRAKAAAYYLGRRCLQIVQDDPDDDVREVAALLRKVNRAGSDAAHLRGRLYKGQGGVWRLRTYEP